MLPLRYATIGVPQDPTQPFTDYTHWRLSYTEDGGHIWNYLSTEEARAAWPQKVVDKFWLGLGTNLKGLSKPKDAMDAARNGFKFLQQLQGEDGHWSGEYSGPMFLNPGLVIGSYVSGMDFTQQQRLEMIRYLLNRAHPVDGGWGLHVEGVSSCFGTVMNYTAARLLGLSADHPAMLKARATLLKLGGATHVPAWGKFWLSVLNVYDWDGNNPIPPELWLLPDWVPIHPHRWWIHTRNVYIPMSYIYGLRFQCPETDIIRALREEIYTQDYHAIHWPSYRNTVCPVDIYHPHTPLLDGLNSILAAYEQCSFPPLRRAALKRVYQLVVADDENTGHQTIGPVSKMMALVCRTIAEGPESDAWVRHRETRLDFMWLCKDGMFMCGTNGSQLWDIAFITQALVETGLAEEDDNRQSCIDALKWLDQCQIKDNPRHYKTAYRHTSKGAWPFSTRTQGYTVSDCTGEGLKAVLYLQKHLSYTPQLIAERRILDAVDVLLSMQNDTGGFASYELRRCGTWLEVINPAEVFGRIMVEQDYPECTTSVVTALSIFKKYYPDYRRNDIERVTNRAISWIHKAQQPEGGWYGSWGICFTYATMFALESLSLAGETYENSEKVKRACDYLISHQRSDGGWGESYLACAKVSWVDHAETQVVQTAWATMALMYGKYPHSRPIKSAVKLVMSRQLPDGSWAQEAIEGMFNNTCAIAYPNFKFSFTIWMLGKAHRYLAALESDKKQG